MRRSSLTGSWSGAYRYPGDIFPETVFNAQIEERDGAFVGETQEPNLDPLQSASVFTAEIEGVRVGLDVTFTKFYGAEAAVGFAIRYEGHANDVLTRIVGTWTNPFLSGSFFMVRDDEAAASETEAEASAEVLP
jgi:hypothetical protein